MATSARFGHLRALTDARGVFEHALLDIPRREHGYCVDDVARALIVVVRDPEHDDLRQLSEIYLSFLESALGADGLTHNRMNEYGEWTDEPGMGDWWGRLIWALGTAAARAPWASVRARSLDAFHRAAQQHSSHLRTVAYAALGAGEVASIRPHDEAAERLLRALILAVPARAENGWAWPEARLSYGNASIADALITAGAALRDRAAMDRGLELLGFLLDGETSGDRLSVTGVGGRADGEVGPFFDQQPIEIAALVDACAHAYEQTSDVRWHRGIDLGWQWFLGDNDSGIPMVDAATGAGFDGLERGGRNENRGAESTLAALSTYQQAHRLGVASRA